MAPPRAPGPTEIGFTPDTEAEILASVTKEIESQIASAVKPLETQRTQLGTDRDNAVGSIGSLFNTVEGSAKDSATRVRTDYDQTLAAEKAIIGEARDRMTDLRNQRAAEAQRLAQEIGRPIPIEEFTNPADLETSLFDSASAGSLLKASGLALGDVQYAEAFSGRVLPLMRAREIAQTRATFDREITRINGEIAAIKAQKGGLINEGVRKRSLEEREFALARATANRDWSLAKQTTKLEAERLRLQAEEIYGGQVTYDPKTGTYTPKPGGAPTLTGRELTEAQKLSREAAIKDREAYAYDLVEAYMTPGVETVKGGSVWMPASGPEQAGAFWNGNQWMVAVKGEDQQITRPAVTNPNQLVDALVSKGIPRELARKVIAKQPGFKGWTEGEQPGDPTKPNTRPSKQRPGANVPRYTTEELKKLSPAQLIKHARALGFNQKVPPGILKYGRKGKEDPITKRGDNPVYDPKKYNELVKQFYLYWIKRIYADDQATDFDLMPAGK
jgi:hypothetical protein